MDETGTRDQAATLAEQARRLLATRRSGAAGPELRKVVASLPDALDEIGRLLDKRLAADQPLDEGTVARLEALLAADLAGLDLDGAWQLLEGLQHMFLALGGTDPAYVGALLDVEAGLEARGEEGWEEPWPYFGWGRVRWRDLFAPDQLPGLAGGIDQPAVLEEAVEHLNALFRARMENGRKRRTRLAVRDRFFLYALLVFAPLVAVLVPLTVRAADDVTWPMAWLAAVAGAVGGTVSGVLKLRALVRITEFRLVGLGLLVQPFVGAAAAMFLVFVLLSGVVELPGVEAADPSWAGLAAYAFAAGFSEPFWLGVVHRLAGGDDAGSVG